MQLNKLERENEINEQKYEKFETRLHIKEREFVSKRLTQEVYEEQLNKYLRSPDEPDNKLNREILIDRFRKDLKQMSKEIPKLKSQVDSIQMRIDSFEQCKKKLIQMRNECTQFDQQVQTALEEKILKENYFNRLQNCRDIIHHIYKCRKTDDLPQKIFYSLPIKSKRSGENTNGK